MPFYFPATTPTANDKPRVLYSVLDPGIDHDQMTQEDVDRYVAELDGKHLRAIPGAKLAAFRIVVLDKQVRNNLFDRTPKTSHALQTAFFRGCVLDVGNMLRVDDDGTETVVTITAKEFELLGHDAVVREIGEYAYMLNSKGSPDFFGPVPEPSLTDSDTSTDGG